ncbi:Hypothetical protein SMAX5B_003352 [Scophthalmus maximus]|uniref:Uncharacterized protein n=1 Tax=Scophthalmus maximus TaxID=52904 RepID=A0A2U9BHZ7_SCOMX|nr:Hypothetical protein SMAX5B_003352 [Scophthalmus maximus]KAF0046538.1 hypothetical protein F2P81_000171 [Scophthalmus maximus]
MESRATPTPSRRLVFYERLWPQRELVGRGPRLDGGDSAGEVGNAAALKAISVFSRQCLGLQGRSRGRLRCKI